MPVHAFETSDAIAFDLLTLRDASIIDGFKLPRFAVGFPALKAEFTRLSIDRASGRVSRRALSDVSFDFPQVDWERAGTGEASYVFGVSLWQESGALRSQIVRVSTAGEATRVFRDDRYVLGEPVFVGAPGRQREGDGVLLSVGSGERGSALFVLDATTLEALAHAEFDTPLPFGFHGSFSPG
ncbi:MAG: hypothetical protein RL701_2085 [Pseudomonadota bacterium]